MLIRFTKLTNERHRFEIVRESGTSESREMETRSTLLHDLTHYAVETEARLTSSFYGQLAAGRAYDALTALNDGDGREPMQTERVVVFVQTASKEGDWQDVDVQHFAKRIADSLTATGGEAPAWLDGALIARVRERLRQVYGRWRGTPFGETMELKFPPEARTLP
jgi:hypothetical protein